MKCGLFASSTWREKSRKVDDLQKIGKRTGHSRDSC
jgi:hypothetical protein